MKKLAIFAIVVASLFIAGTALADSYVVTNNFGVRVTEKGECEQIGATTLTPDTGSAWAVAQEVTIELLGNATLCYSFNYVGEVVGGTTYDVLGTAGDDYFTVTITATAGAEDALVYGNAATPICFDLSGTTYNSQDPNNQLVKVSYRDDLSNTYSGDIYVATVKPTAHDVTVCTKAQGESLSLLGWVYPGDYDLEKDGLPVIDFCVGTSTDQDQVTTDCGEDIGDDVACISIDDPSNVFNSNDYSLAVTTGYEGVGISDVVLYDNTYAAIPAGAFVYTYYAVENPGPTDVPIVPGVGGAVWSDVKRFEIAGATIPSGRIYAAIEFTADTCVAVDGTLTVDYMMTREPCGDSTVGTDLAVAYVDVCGDTPAGPTGYNIPGVLPYFTDLNTGWWSGLALTNITDADETVTLTIYEADGDMYTCTVVVPANSIVADVFTATGYAGSAITTTSTDAAFGDERFSILYDQFYEVYGFALLGDGMQAQGYLGVVDYMGMP